LLEIWRELEAVERRRNRTMKVTVIGAGNMGRGIGHVLVRGGHSVTIVDRDPEDAGRLAEELRGAARGGATVEAEAPGAGVSDEVVILAVWYPSSLEAARELGEELGGKVVVDISNPVNQTFDGLATEPGTSAAEELAGERRRARGSSRPSTPRLQARSWRGRSRASRSTC
jgi:8-hydroxy-5-deazaflavin:NADPH oxidoreductase